MLLDPRHAHVGQDVICAPHARESASPGLLCKVCRDGEQPHECEVLVRMEPLPSWA